MKLYFPCALEPPNFPVSLTALLKGIRRRINISRMRTKRNFLRLKANPLLLDPIAESLMSSSIDCLMLLAAIVNDLTASTAAKVGHFAAEVASSDKLVGDIESDALIDVGNIWVSVLAVRKACCFGGAVFGHGGSVCDERVSVGVGEREKGKARTFLSTLLDEA